MILLCLVQKAELKSGLISARTVVGFDDNYWDEIMTDRVLVATSGHIAVGIDSSNTYLAVRI